MGRTADLDRLRSAIDVPAFHAVVITAPAGVGKTRLVRQATTTLESPPLWLQASPAVATVPFGVLAHHPDLPIDDPAAMYRWITTVADEGGGVVVVDDAPHLDARTADLLHRLVAARATTVVATARAGVPVPSWLEWLWLGESTEHIELGPLHDDDIGHLVEIVLGNLDSNQNDRVVASLSARTNGNALFIRQLLLDLRQRRDAGGETVLDATAPTHLLRVLQARLSDAGDVIVPLRCVAVLGDLPLLVLRCCVTDAQIDAAEAAGWLVIEGSPRATARPAHPLYAEASLAAMTTLERSDLSEQVARRVVTTVGTTAGERLRATAALVGLGATVDVDDLVDAARTAFAALDHDLARTLAQAAVDNGATFEALLVLGAAQSGLGQSDDAETALRLALATADTDDRRARAVGRLSVHLVADGGRVDEAEALLDEIEPLLSDVAARSFVAADRAKLASIRGDLTAVSPRLADGADDLTRLNAAIVGAYIDAMAGNAAACRATIARALPLAEAHTTVLPWSAELVRFSGPFAALLEAGPTAAEAEAREGGSRIGPAADATLGTWNFLTGFTAAIAGRLDSSMLTLDRAIDELDGHDLINARPLAMAARSWVAAQSGEVDHARILLDASVDAAAVDGRVRIQASIADVWCDLVEGDLPPGTIDRLSAERLLAMAGEAFDSAQALTAVIVLHELVRLGDPGTALNPLRQIAGELPPSWFVQFVTDRANAEAVQDDARLHRLAREAHHRWPLAAAEMHASRARIARSRRDSVAESRATVLSAIESVRLGPTQPWSLRSLRSPLTPRELEVASAVAAGTANRAVAEQAGVSVRTVENQLQSTYRKLDLEGRQDLVALFNLSP